MNKYPIPTASPSNKHYESSTTNSLIRKYEDCRKNESEKVEMKTSELVAKLNLTPHPEGGFYSETFRDDSVTITTAHLPPQCKKHQKFINFLSF